MKILITGGSSYLGQYLVPLVAGQHEVCYTFFQHDPLGLSVGQMVDMRLDSAVFQLVHSFRPDVIIHTVGSNRTADMETLIPLSTQYITQAATAVHARLIHLSTDSIFNGLNPPYSETSPPTPVNSYGRAKAAAETIVQQHPDHVIVRTSLIYDLQEMDHGTAWMVRALQAGQPVKLFANQIRHPVWRHSLSQACLELITHVYTGILNVVGQQALSRAQFGLKLLDWWGISQRQRLTIGDSGTDWPLDCRMDVSLATAVLQTPLPGVDEVLSQFTDSEARGMKHEA